jgi:hypothetical protein
MEESTKILESMMLAGMVGEGLAMTITWPGPRINGSVPTLCDLLALPPHPYTIPILTYG